MCAGGVVPLNIVLQQGSITSPDLVNYVMAEEGIDTVMHFAAQTHVGPFVWVVICGGDSALTALTGSR